MAVMAGIYKLPKTLITPLLNAEWMELEAEGKRAASTALLVFGMRWYSIKNYSP